MHASLDVRHASDRERSAAAVSLIHAAQEIAIRRELGFEWEKQLSQDTVTMDQSLTAQLERAANPAVRLFSGAGHDAMVIAPHIPSAMLFLRSPGGISHHPDESVLEADVDAAMRTGLKFIASLDAEYGGVY